MHGLHPASSHSPESLAPLGQCTRPGPFLRSFPALCTVHLFLHQAISHSAPLRALPCPTDGRTAPSVAVCRPGCRSRGQWPRSGPRRAVNGWASLSQYDRIEASTRINGSWIRGAKLSWDCSVYAPQSCRRRFPCLYAFSACRQRVDSGLRLDLWRGDKGETGQAYALTALTPVAARGSERRGSASRLTSWGGRYACILGASARS